MKSDFIFTSESVTEGHPDKLCDQISDALVDCFLQQDPFSIIAAECAVATGILFIAARFAADAAVDIAGIARQTIAGAGYDSSHGFDPNLCSVMTSLNEIAGANRSKRDEAELDDAEIEKIAPANQATVFGFACTQTPGLMPLPIWLAHKLARGLADARNSGDLPYLAPDGKSQVAVEYRNRRPFRIHSITVISATKNGLVPDATTLGNDIMGRVVASAFAEESIRPDANTLVFVNPGGPFRDGGPGMHAGLTGRKSGVDTYGEYARQSDSALSGKDPSRIDRIGAYAARYAARNVIVAGLAEECEIQLSYTIGRARPVSMQVETFATGTIPDTEIARRIMRAFDFRPASIIRHFDLRRLPAQGKTGFYRHLAAYGHVGRTDLSLPWETDGLSEQLAD